jgi:hypothetical protein
MHDCANLLFGQDSGEQPGVLDIAFVEGYAFGHGEAEAGYQVVDYRDWPAGIDQGQNRVATDVTGAAGDKNGTFLHRSDLIRDRSKIKRLITATGPIRTWVRTIGLASHFRGNHMLFETFSKEASR